jgi:hypothetical protein
MPPVLGVPVQAAAQQAVRAPLPPRRDEPPGKKIRVFHKQVWATWAGLGPDEVSNLAVLIFARSRAPRNRDGTPGTLIDYSIGDEFHHEPSNPNQGKHKHAVLVYSNKISMRDSRYSEMFDMQGGNGMAVRTLHPQVEGVGRTTQDRHQCAIYSQKDGNYIARARFQNLDPDRYEETWAEKLNQATSVDGGMRMLMQDHASMYYTNGSRIEPMLLRRIGQNSDPPYPPSAFIFAAPTDLSLAMVVYGNSRIGKTCWVMSWFKHPLVISEMDDLHLISLETDAVIFDDVCLDAMKPESIIRLLDTEFTRCHHARYRNATIPKGMPSLLALFSSTQSGKIDTLY